MQLEITDAHFKKQIVFLLNNNWTGKGDMYFPLQNSVNIEKRYLFKLRNFKYIFYKKNTCLLYTSPSPRDDISSRMPSSA